LPYLDKDRTSPFKELNEFIRPAIFAS